MILDVLLTLFLVALNGFFVAAEFAMVKVRAAQIELRVRTGNVFAGAAKAMIDNLDAYLSATQLGITLASLGLGYIGERVMAAVVLDVLAMMNIQLPEDMVHKVSFVLAFSIITVLHIVLGELAPKSLAIQRSESVTLAVAYPMQAFYFVFRPFIWVLNSLANIILGIMGIEPAKEQELHSAEELRFLLEESQKHGTIEEEEHKLIENVFEFTETEVRSVMVPRGKIVALELSMPSADIIQKVMDEGFSRMPVYSESIDSIVGVVYTKDLLSLMSMSNLILLHDILRPAVFVSEEEKISVLMKRIQRERFHMAIVLDEFGGTAGIITLEDVLEELVGEIQDEYDEETPNVEQRNGVFFVKAQINVTDLNEVLPKPLPESDEYDTLGGLISYSVGKIPEANETFQLEGGYTCTVLARTKRVVEHVKLVPPAPTEEELLAIKKS